MAFIETRKYAKKTTYRVHFILKVNEEEVIPKPKFDTRDDAENFLPIAMTIENKVKSQTAPPQEVSLWVSQGYLDQDTAARVFPIYAALLDADKKARVPIDWNLIEEEYSDAKIDRSGDKDELSDNHRTKMSLFRRVKQWLTEEHSTLELTRSDVEARLRFMRNNGWHDPFKLDRFGCEDFLAEEATHEAQGKQPASPLKTIDAVIMEKDPIVVWAIEHPMSLRKT